MRRAIVIEKAPLALMSDGAILLNLAFVRDADLDGLVQFAREIGGRIVVGVVLGGRHLATVRKDIDDAAFDLGLHAGSVLLKAKGRGALSRARRARK